MVITLCALPNELIISIFAFIEDQSSLHAFACVSSRYRPFAEARLYHSILLRDIVDNKNQLHLHCTRLHHALKQEPRRAAAVRSLTLVPFHKPGLLLQRDLLKVFKSILRSCTNLSELYVESPLSTERRWNVKDSFWWSLEEVILDSLGCLLPLQRLTKLTLHLNGYRQEFWDPTRSQVNQRDVAHDDGPSWAKVIALSSLVDVTVSCALIQGDILTAPKGSTNLKSLSIIECDITLEGLAKLLSAPRALAVLRLGENTFYPGQEYPNTSHQTYNNLFGHNPKRFITALEQQAHSLVELEYVAGVSNHGSKNVELTFEAFNRLKKVTLSEHVTDRCRELLLMTAPVLEDVFLTIPAAKVFDRVIRLEDELDLQAGKVGDDVVKRDLSGRVSTALFRELPEERRKLLKNLHIIMPQNPIPINGSRRTWIIMLADYWKNHGVDLWLFSHRSMGYCPPILFDEHDKAPKDILLFSTQGGFAHVVDAPEVLGFEGPWEIGFDGSDVLENFDFDAFLHDGGHADFDFDFAELETPWPF